MNIYPNLRLNASDFEHRKNDGRVSSNAEDGTPRAQILFSQVQHTFSVLHFLLDENEREIVEDFHSDNAALEFYYDCPFNKKRYQCIFLSPPPEPQDHVGNLCSLVVKFTGHEVLNG